MKSNLTRRLFALLLAIVITACMIPVYAVPTFAGETENGLVYTISGGEVTITDYTGSSDFLAADLDGDGSITVKDAFSLKCIISGSIAV